MASILGRYRNVKINIIMKQIKHGTNSGYTKKCRCQECKTAHAIANRHHTKIYYKKNKVMSDNEIYKASLKREPDYKFSGYSK